MFRSFYAAVLVAIVLVTGACAHGRVENMVEQVTSSTPDGVTMSNAKLVELYWKGDFVVIPTCAYEECEKPTYDDPIVILLTTPHVAGGRPQAIIELTSVRSLITVDVDQNISFALYEIPTATSDGLYFTWKEKEHCGGSGRKMISVKQKKLEFYRREPSAIMPGVKRAQAVVRYHMEICVRSDKSPDHSACTTTVWRAETWQDSSCSDPDLRLLCPGGIRWNSLIRIARWGRAADFPM